MKILNKIINRYNWLISFPIFWYYKIIFKKPDIRSIEETIDNIIKNHSSVARYGDGELDIMVGRNIPFQDYDKVLAQKMKDILHYDDKKFLVCINDSISTLDGLIPETIAYWKKKLRYNLKWYYRLLKKNKIYYNACITRPYHRYKNKENAGNVFNKLMQIWNNRDIVFIEGEKSRLGVGNDLYENARSIKRILCPPKNAYSYYDDIISFTTNNIPKDTLLLIALGPTATAMAYDFYKIGYQAIDMGHVDIEYEWFKLGATEKVPIKNKYTNEAIGGTEVGEIFDEKYNSQIIKRIGI